MIEMQHVYKIYPNGVEALSDVSLMVRKGEFVFIVGASGAGKSTLIKMLIREIMPDRGTLKVNGRDLVRMKRREVPYLRRSIGVVFQDFRLLYDHSVYDNVAFALRVTGYLDRDIRKRVPEVLDMVGLGKRLQCTPRELSGGEQQRVTLARALAGMPSIIIADEPTGNLDPKTSEEIMAIIKTINIRGTTIIMATHAKDIVNSLRQRVVVLRKGRLVQDKAEGGYSHEDP
jgi:cell division transport system ATP-binding protein